MVNHQQGNAFLSGVLRDILQDSVITKVLEAWDGRDQQQMRPLTDLWTCREESKSCQYSRLGELMHGWNTAREDRRTAPQEEIRGDQRRREYLRCSPSGAKATPSY